MCINMVRLFSELAPLMTICLVSDSFYVAIAIFSLHTDYSINRCIDSERLYLYSHQQVN